MEPKQKNCRLSSSLSFHTTGHNLFSASIRYALILACKCLRLMTAERLRIFLCSSIAPNAKRFPQQKQRRPPHTFCASVRLKRSIIKIINKHNNNTYIIYSVAHAFMNFVYFRAIYYFFLYIFFVIHSFASIVSNKQ